MTIEFDSRPFWKPRDLAAMLDVSPSQIYRLVEAGDLEHVKVGQRTVRVPAASVALYLGHSAPGTKSVREEADVETRARRFKERTGRTPADFIAAWRREEIEDTSEHNQDAMEALALREAGVGSSSMAIA
jgi:excisionase family DNA binding protein